MRECGRIQKGDAGRCRSNGGSDLSIQFLGLEKNAQRAFSSSLGPQDILAGGDH